MYESTLYPAGAGGAKFSLLSSVSLFLSWSMGRKGRIRHYLLPQWFAKLLANEGPTLGVDGEFRQTHFLSGSHREDSLGLVSPDSVTAFSLERTTSCSLFFSLSLSPPSFSHPTRDHDRVWLLDKHENRIARTAINSAAHAAREMDRDSRAARSTTKVAMIRMW